MAAEGRNVIIAQITWARGALIYDDISTASSSIPSVKAKKVQTKDWWWIAVAFYAARALTDIVLM